MPSLFSNKATPYKVTNLKIGFTSEGIDLTNIKYFI